MARLAEEGGEVEWIVGGPALVVYIDKDRVGRQPAALQGAQGLPEAGAGGGQGAVGGGREAFGRCDGRTGRRTVRRPGKGS